MSQLLPLRCIVGGVVKRVSEAVPPSNALTAPGIVRLATFLREEAKRLVANDGDGTPLFDQAQQVLSQGLKFFPSDSKLLNEQGHLYYDTEKYDKALEKFEVVIKQNPRATAADRLVAFEYAGASLRELRRFYDADDMFQQAVALSGGPSIRLLIERGWLRFYQGSYDLAINDFVAAQSRSGIDKNSQREARVGQVATLQVEDTVVQGSDRNRAKELMDGWLRSGELSKKEAASILFDTEATLNYLNLYQAASLNYDQLLDLEHSNPKAWLAKISGLKWLRRFGEAEKLCQTALEKFPDDIPLWSEMGFIFYLQKKFQKACDYFSGNEKNLNLRDDSERKAFVRKIEEDEDANEWAIVSARKMRALRKAEERVNGALDKFGDRPAFLCEKGFIRFTQRKYDDAIALFDRALKVDEYYSFAHQWRVATFRKMREFDKAKDELAKALLKLPNAAGLWEERAWIAFDQSQLEKAHEYFLKAIELDPYLIQTQFSLAEVLTRLNQNDEALDIMLRLKAQFKDDIEVAEQLGWLYLRRGEIDHANDEFGRIESRDSDNALGLKGWGGYHLEQRDYQSAEKKFRKAIDQIDYEPQYYINLAWALVREVKEPGELSETQLVRRNRLLDIARNSCRDALNLDPFDAKAHVCLGVIAFKRGAFADAEGYFRKSIELSPSEGGHVELGALYVQMGRLEEAEKALEEAVRQNPRDARAHIELANLMVSKGTVKEAIRECRHAVAIEPYNDEAHRALSIALMRDGQDEEAERTLRKALMQVEPGKRWRLHLVLSQILIRLGDDKNKDVKKKDRDNEYYGEALDHVYKALRIQPSPNADVYFHAGIANFRLEDYATSWQNFNDCLKTDRNRFEAGRYGLRVLAAMEQQKNTLKVALQGGKLLAAVCLVMLVALWTLYLSGVTRPVPVAEPEPTSNKNANTAETTGTGEAGKAEAAVKNAVKAAEAAKVAEAKSADAVKAKAAKELEAANAATATTAATGAKKVALNNVAEAKKAESAKAAEAAKAAEDAHTAAVASANEALKEATKPQTPRREVIVDKSMLTVYTPILLALFVIALLLPHLTKVTLPGGISADISEVRAEISTGPKGDVGFGSSLPIISPGPR